MKLTQWGRTCTSLIHPPTGIVMGGIPSEIAIAAQAHPLVRGQPSEFAMIVCAPRRAMSTVARCPLTIYLKAVGRGRLVVAVCARRVLRLIERLPARARDTGFAPFTH